MEEGRPTAVRRVRWSAALTSTGTGSSSEDTTSEEGMMRICGQGFRERIWISAYFKPTSFAPKQACFPLSPRNPKVGGKNLKRLESIGFLGG